MNALVAKFKFQFINVQLIVSDEQFDLIDYRRLSFSKAKSTQTFRINVYNTSAKNFRFGLYPDGYGIHFIVRVFKFQLELM